MAVNLGAISAFFAGNNPATFTVPLDPPDGHLKILVVWTKQPATVIETPSGWVQEFLNASTAVDGGQLAVFSRMKQPSDTGLTVVNFTGGTTGNTCMARSFSLSGIRVGGFRTSAIIGKNAAAANIGPIGMPTSLQGVDGAILVIGSRSDDWTSVATFSTAAGLTWEEVFENSSTLGNDGGFVVELGHWSGPAPINEAPIPSLPDKTFVVTGGGAAPGQYISVGIIPAIVESGAPSLAAQRAHTAGTGTRTPRVAKTGTGVLVGRAAVTAGVAERTLKLKTAPAALVAARATVIGAGKAGTLIEDIGTEAIVGGRASVTASAGSVGDTTTTITSTSASLVARSSFCSAIVLVERKGTGVLVAAPATVVGSSERLVEALPSTMTAGSAGIVATSAKGKSGVGVLVAGSAAIATTETIQRKGAGVLIAGPPTMTIVGGPHPASGEAGAGDLRGASATIAATATLSKTAGVNLLAQPATLTGSGSRLIMWDAALEAGYATLQAEVSFAIDDSWEADDMPWGQPAIIHARSWPVFVKDKSFYQAEITNSFDKIPVHVVLERSGLTILGRDRHGNWKNEPGVIKFVTGVWPLLRGTPGAVVKIYVGGQMTTEDPIRWEGPYQAIIGETEFLDFTVSGRYISLRFESEAQPPWELVSYDLELTQVGSR
jgi:hypothetical protein